MGSVWSKLGCAGVVLTSPLLINCGKSSFEYEKAAAPAIVGPSALNSRMTVSGNNVADGVTPAIVTFEIKDHAGLPVSGVTMNVNVGGSQNNVQPCSPTNAAGISQCMVYSTASELKLFNGWGCLTFNENVWFDATTPLRSAFGIVSSGSVETLPSGHKIISSSGISESFAVQQDSSNVMRLYSSILGSIIGD